MKRYLILTLVAALSASAAGCGGKPTDTGPLPVAALPTGAAAQGDDKAYCEALGALALRFIRSAGGDGGSAPDLNVLGAITDCNRGRYDRGIPLLERRLRGAGITLPPR
jgi:hypothetical protein